MQVSGLVTGLDTSSLVKQLMAVERLPGNRLVEGKTDANALSGALTRLNGLVRSLGDAAKDVASGIPDIWTSQKATSSTPEVATVSALSSAPPASLSFTVASVAQAGGAVSAELNLGADGRLLDAGQPVSSLSFAIRTGTNPADPADPTARQTTVTVDSSTVDISGGATIHDVAEAINKHPDAGVTASVLTVREGTYRLQLVAKETGAASNVTLTDATAPPGTHNLLGSFSTLYQGKDTRLHFGDAPPAGYDLTSPTTKVTGLAEGLTVTAVKADPANPVTVTVARDVDAMAGKVEAMVKAANEALSNIRINSKADLENKGSGKADGAFVANSTVRDLSTQISNAFVGSGALIPSVAGVSLERDGTVKFDKAAFTAAYAKDPAKVAETMTATASKLADVGKAATNATDGMLTVAIRGADALQKDYTDQIRRFDERMTRREEMLTRQYAALDSMLSKMKSQSDWLAGQLAALPNISYSNTT